jgi:tetratricopeptide (TPR) repeat protein
LQKTSKLTNQKIPLKAMLILIALIVVASFSFIVIKTIYDPNIPFLETDVKANWILYPLTPSTWTRSENYVNLTARFTKNFELTARPAEVYLHIKGLKEYRLWVNDNQLSAGFAERTNWKRERRLEISQFLKEGTNTIRTEVSNKYGPPVLWLYTQGMKNEIKTDTSWTVSISDSLPVRANLANDCSLHLISLQCVPPLEGLYKKLPMLILFFLISSMVFWLNNSKQRNTKFNTSLSQRFLIFTPKRILMICIIVWIIVFLNNAAKISLTEVGFDVQAHLGYVQYLIDHKFVPPLANEGWEFFQPPLFYFASAIVFLLGKLFLAADQAPYSLKLIPFLCGIGQICLVYFASRKVFPNSQTKQSLSVAITALIPMNIYISSYFSNESLSALLIGLTILVTIIILNSSQSFLRLYCILGLVIGLAILTKITVLTILPVIFLVLLYKQLSEEKHPITLLGKKLGLMFLIIVVIAGWFYVRNWMHFGKVFITSWDYSLLSPWWQDPGFHTYKYFCQFGKVFTMPYFAGTYSFFDSIYSTFWGDAYLGSANKYTFRPPWNYEYMSAVYLLAIPAALAIIIGTVCAIVNVVYTANKSWLLVLGSFGISTFSIIYMNLQLPYYCLAKAFYGLGVILPIGLIFALGFDWLDQRLRDKKLFLLRMVLYGWFGTLIMAILLSFFVSPGQANAAYYSDLDVRAKQGQLAQAVAYYTQILHNNPEDWDAHCQLAKAYFLQHEYDKAIEHYSQTVRIKPDYIDALNDMGVALHAAGRIDEAVVYYKKAIEIDPCTYEANANLGFVLASMGKFNEAIEHYEIAMATMDTPRIHSNYAEVLFNLGRFEQAIAQYRKALLTMPNDPNVINELGYTLAHTGKIDEAITLYNKALRISPDRIEIHLNLGAALTGSGKFEDALKEYEKILLLQPQNAVAHNDFGVVLYRLGKLDDAIAQFRRAVQINSEYADAKNNLSAVLAEKQKSSNNASESNKK